VTDPERRTALAEAERVLTAPALAPLFRPDALAAVEVSGRSAVLDAPVLGAVDRLIVAPGRVRAVDFKTNRVVPATVEEVPEGLLRQMGAYAEILAAIYPDHAIETEILWSRTAELMPLPSDLVHAALLRAAAA